MRLRSSLILHFNANENMMEVLLFLIKKFSNSFTFYDKEALLTAIHNKIEDSFHQDVGFLAHSRNPVKIALLII